MCMDLSSSQLTLFDSQLAKPVSELRVWIILNLFFFLKVIFGKSSGSEFLHEVYTPVTYHNKQVFTPMSGIGQFPSLFWII